MGQCLINTHAKLVEQDWGQHGLSENKAISTSHHIQNFSFSG